MLESVIQNDEITDDIERQWRETEYLSVLLLEAEPIENIRKQKKQEQPLLFALSSRYFIRHACARC